MANLENKYILYLIFITVSFGLIGFYDDYKKLKKNKNGISAKNKIALQLIAAGIISYTMFAFVETAQEQQLIIPFFKDIVIDLGIFFIPFVNLIFFMILSILPNRKIENTEELPPPNWVSRRVPLTIWKSFLFSASTSVLPCLFLLIIAVQLLQNYGWGVFVGLPFVQGMFTVLLHSCHHRRNYSHCIILALSAFATVSYTHLTLPTKA